MSACPDCKCDPGDLMTLGRHAAAACVNPDCPADCQDLPDSEPEDDEAAEAVARAWMFGE